MVHNFSYLSEYDPGLFGNQRGSFILYGGNPADIKIYNPTDPTGVDLFHWLNRTNLTIEQAKYKFDRLNRSDIIINTVDSKFEINLLNDRLPVEKGVHGPDD